VRRFPGARGRIPNFVGAERAADRLRELDVWKRAAVLKCNPDSPQRPVRLRALKEGKIVYMAVPRLRQSECFIELDPSRLGRQIGQASSIEGAFRFGRSVRPERMKEIDLIVCGTVAVNREGARIGKGGGYSDIEYGLAREAKLGSQERRLSRLSMICRSLKRNSRSVLTIFPSISLPLQHLSSRHIPGCRGQEESTGNICRTSRLMRFLT